MTTHTVEYSFKDNFFFFTKLPARVAGLATSTDRKAYRSPNCSLNPIRVISGPVIDTEGLFKACLLKGTFPYVGPLFTH